MPKATQDGGRLNFLTDCYINIPGALKIVLNILPEITDSKSASYNDEIVIGRSTPIKTYSHSDNRSISMLLHFIATDKSELLYNLSYMRAIESVTYPQNGNSSSPFLPPPICQIRCGKLLGEAELNVVLKSYSISFPVDVVWDEETYIPWKIDISTTWDVVYPSNQLPGQEMVLNLG